MIRASDLIGCVIRTESGERLGRVHDLRAHLSDDGWLLVGVVTGPKGVFARFTGGQDEEPTRGGNVIPWEAITRLEEGLVVVRDEVAAVP